MHRPAVLALALMLAPQLAAAAPARKPSPADAIPKVEAAATECFAQAILVSQGSMAKARAGLWYEAASVMGHICRPEVDAMMRARDMVEGPGAGARHFRKVYVRHLGKVLSARLGPDLRVTYATAEAPVDKQ